MNTYENWNKNPELWKSIESVISSLEKSLNTSWNFEKFKNFYLSKSCFTKEDTFTIVGKYSLQKVITYIEDREGLNKKRWNKEKQEIENSFKIIFDKFILPEQSAKPIVNPLLNKTTSAILAMDDYASKVFSYDDLARIFNLEDSIYSDRLDFQFFIYKKNSSLKDNVKSGINEIEDNNQATIMLDINIYIKSPLEYCLETINSSILSEILFYKYLDSQLQAYFGYKNYPNKKINVINIQEYPFNSYIKNPGSDYRVTYNSHQIYYIPKADLSYEKYILETKQLYNSTKQEITGELYNIQSIKNRVISFNPIVNQLVYTDNFGSILKLDLTESENLSQERINCLLKTEISSEVFKTFLDILKGIYLKLDIYNKEDVDSIFTQVNTYTYLYELTNTSCPEFFKILNSCYNAWNDINYDIILKLQFKIYLEVLLFEKIRDIQLGEPLNLTTIHLENNGVLPTDLTKQLKTLYKNQITNFPEVFRDTYYFSKISLLFQNNKASKFAIITKQDLEVYNKLQITSGGNFNGIVLNTETLTKLYSDYGNNLHIYLTTLPKNTVFIINPEVFFNSSILGNTELYLANKLSFRYLIIELLKTINLTYTVFYKDFDIYSNKFILSCLRQIFSVSKYKEIYGSFNSEDMLVLTANCFSPEESNYFGNISNISVICRSILPRIHYNTHYVDITKNQEQYYQELLNISHNNLKNNKDFQNLVLNSDLDNSQELAPFISNYLSLSNIFLNSPSNSLFSYKDKFDSEENLNLFSNKLDILYNLLASDIYGGLVNGIKKPSKSGSTLVICENRIVRDHLYKNLSDRFFGDICYKFIAGSSKEIREFKNKRIGFITKDILFNNIILSNINNYIIVQTSFYENYLEEYDNYITFNAINTFPDSIEVNYLVFNNTLEVNNFIKAQTYYLKNKRLQYIDNPYFNKYLSVLKDLPEFSNTYETLEIFSDNLQKLNLEEKIKVIQDYELCQEGKIKDKYIDILLKKLNFKVSNQDLYDILYSVLSNLTIRNIKTIPYIPFINNMVISNRNLIPYQVNEKFSDINGNFYYYINEKIQKNIPVYTEYGTGYIEGENTRDFDIKVINSKEFLVSKNLTYIPNKNSLENYMDYIKSISTQGDSSVNLALLEEKQIHKKNEEIQLDQADNSINLSVDRINGQFSLYTSDIDIDNLRLEDFNFNKYSNIFAASISNIHEFSDIVEKLTRYNVDDKYLNVVKTAFKEWLNGNEFMLPVEFDYFNTNHTKEENPRVYTLIWNKKFYIIWNGNFYQKLGLKLSRKIKVTLIKSLFIQQYKDSKTCKYELLKISKTLNILNLQEILNFFNQNFIKVNYLEVSDSIKDNKNTLIDALKAKEIKLKEHIRKLRRQKYGEE